MTAGKGIEHSEMLVKSQTRAHRLQLWIIFASGAQDVRAPVEALYACQTPLFSIDPSSEPSQLNLLSHLSLLSLPLQEQECTMKKECFVYFLDFGAIQVIKNMLLVCT